MGRTFIRQDIQIRKSDVYVDTTYPSLAAYQTNPVNIEDDLNSLRSVANHLATVGAGTWYTPIPTPGTFENGTARGVHTINQSLHDLERKRLLERISMVGVNITGGTGQHVVLTAPQLPNYTTLAIGAVTSLGTVVATASPFSNPSVSAVVTGANALQPKNLLRIVDSSSGDPILDSVGREVFGLLQSESSVNGSTCSDTGPNRLQISYVVRNSTNDALILATAGVLNGKTFDYGFVRRAALQDLPEEAWLGDGFVDSGVANVTRQSGYDNQGTTPVNLATNATLDLEGPGLIWAIRDDLESEIFKITEGSAGGTTEVTVTYDVDQFNVQAAANNFIQGLKVSLVSNEIDIGIVPGTISSVGSADLRVLGAGELLLDDGNQTGSTWAQTTGIKLSDTTSEWDAFEIAFGEVSLLNAIVQAKNTGSSRGAKVYANVTANVNADTDVGGIAGGANLDAQLPDMSTGSFLTDYDLYVNGSLMRPGANGAANNDFYPGTSLANGQVKFEFKLKTGDVVTVIPYV
jgi:hypothetical protein